MEPRLKAEIWVKALLRRCHISGAFATVARRGDETAGSIMLKVNSLDGLAIAYVSGFGFNGNRIWRCQPQNEPVEESKIDSYIERTIKSDPDIWVVEIEDRDGRHFLTEPIEKLG